MRLFYLALLSLALGAPGASARQVDSHTDVLAKAKVANGQVPGIVIAQVADGQTTVQGYGRVSRDQAGAPDAHTVFEIGSLTKTFTALLLADAVAHGTVTLADPVQRSLPAYRLPSFGQQGMSLLDLATHTSGLPRLPANLMPARGENPYADYDAGQLKAFLGTYTLSQAPGSHYDYSNLGFGLLGEALCAQAGLDYASLVAARITQPLGMHDTGMVVKPGLRMAEGHDAKGVRQAAWEWRALAGAGALRSTAGDMLLFLQAHMRALAQDGAPAMRMAMMPQRPTSTPGQMIGLAWHSQLVGGRKVIWHNGMAAGHAAFIGMTADGQRGVVVLANASHNVDELGFAALVPAADEALPPMPQATLAQYVGNYQLAPGVALSITAADGGLHAQVSGQAGAAVYPGKPDEFTYRVIEARLQFQRDSEGKVNGVVLHQGGHAMQAPRMAVEAAAPSPAHPPEINLPPETLRQFVGNYQLAPGFMLAVSEAGGQLFIQATGQGRSAVFASAPNEVFSKIAALRIVFQRDAGGSVTGLVLHQAGQEIAAPRRPD